MKILKNQRKNFNDYKKGNRLQTRIKNFEVEILRLTAKIDFVGG